MTGLCLTIVFGMGLCDRASASDNNDSIALDQQTIAQDWLNGLISGKDLAANSQSYKQQLSAIHRDAGKRPSLFRDYMDAEQLWLNSVHKLAGMKQPLDDRQQRYWQSQNQSLAQAYERLNAQFERLKNNPLGNAWHPGKMARLVSIEQQLTRRWQAIEQFKNVPVSQWQPWHKNLLSQLSQTKSSALTQQELIILRNDQLPNSGHLGTAGPLVTTPAIVPSYASEFPAPAQSDDLVSGQVVQLTPEIYQLAHDLDNDYIKIVNFVRQQINIQYYAGSMKGSQGTLLSYAGNDVDQSALLIALLRASNIPARFVQGVIQQPVDEVANGLGLSDPTLVQEALERAGIPHQAVIQGGKIRFIQRQHTWVSAYIPYAHYRGSANDLTEPVWLALAPAIKHITVEPASSDYADLAIDAGQMITDHLMGLGTTEQPLAVWQQQVNAAFAGNLSDLQTVVHNTSDAYTIIPAAMPVKVIAVIYEAADLPAEQIHRVRLQLTDGAVITDVELPMTSLAGRRLSLSYLPATIEDLNLINLAGGMSQVPPALINLRPVFKINGQAVNMEAGDIPMGTFHELDIGLIAPNGSVDLNRTVLAGSYLSLVFSTQTDELTMQAEDAGLVTDETLPVRLMHNLGVHYQNAWRAAENELAMTLNQAIIRPFPLLSIISPEYHLEYVADLPVEMSFTGVSLDAISRISDVISRGLTAEADWSRLAAWHGSWLESQVFADQWAVNAVSADQGIRLMAQAAEQIHVIDAGNAAGIIAGLNHPEPVKQHITGWVSSGYQVTIAQNPTQVDAWSGSAWYIVHPDTGHSGYFIAGGYAGGQTTEPPESWALNDLARMLFDPYAEGANEDALSARYIRLMDSTNNQYGVVNQLLAKPSEVLITDASNRPVINATVRFTMGNTQAEIATEGGYASIYEVMTNQQGRAEVDIKVAERIGNGPFIQVDPQDEHLTQLGQIEMSVEVLSNLGWIPADELFRHYAVPDEPAAILINECNWSLDTCHQAVGQQEMRAGNIYVVVVDQFNNPVPNVPISIEAEAPVPPVGGKAAQSGSGHKNQPLQPAPAGHLFSSVPLSDDVIEQMEQSGALTKSSITGSCDEYTPAKIAANVCFNTDQINLPACAEQQVVMNSDNGWKPFTVYNGRGLPATRFPVKLSVAGLDSQYINRYNGFTEDFQNFFGAGLFYTGEDTNGPNGNFFGDKPGELISKTLQPLYLKYVDFGGAGGCDFVQFTLSDTGEQTTEQLSGNADVTVTGPVDEWQVNYQLGAESSLNTNLISTQDARFAAVSPHGGVMLQRMDFIAPSMTVTADVVSRVPTFFDLADDQTTRQATRFLINISPAEYQPQKMSAVFYENGTEIYRHTVSYPTDALVEAVLPTGLPINPDRTYEIELVLNEGSAYEIIYDKQPLEGINRRLINQVSCADASLFGACGGPVINNTFENAVRLSSDVDLANANVCRQEGFNLNLLADARVTIEAIQHNPLGQDGSNITLLADNELMSAGINEVVARADSLGNHQYTLRITAVAEDNGDEQVVYGGLVSRYDVSNSLPVGHAIVKGVDLADGSMVYSKQDIQLVSPGVDLEFTRTYSSQGRQELGPLGYGWSYNYLSRVIIGSCGQVVVTGADGGSARFRIQGDEFIPLKGYHSSLVLNEDNSFDFYPKGGNRYHYTRRQDNVWWMDYVEDPNGNRLTVDVESRNKAPVIRSVTDSVGRRLLFNYELHDFGIYRNEMLVSVSGPAGILLTFEYDDIGNLIRAQREGDTTNEALGYAGDVSGPNRSLLLTVDDQSTGANRTWSYRNKSVSLPTDMGDLPDIFSIEVASIEESDAGVTSFTYTPGIGYNDNANVTQNGQLSQYTLNDYGAATEITSPAGTRTFNWNTDTDVLLMSETDENNRLRSFEYDQYGNVIEERLGSLISQYSYYAPDQFQPPFIKERVKTHTNWRGDLTEYSYDIHGNKVSEELSGISTGYDHNARGQVITITDGRGNVSLITYDDLGYQSSMRNPEGDETTAVWNARGHKLSETDANGNLITYSYDNSDRMLSKTLNSRIWTHDYENGGLIRTETDPNDNATRYEYDTQGRLLEITNAALDTFTYVYDLNGNKESETDFGGHTTGFSYDAANRLRTKVEPLGKVTTYTYDNVGNVLTETTGDRVTTYTYDPDRYFQDSVKRNGPQGDVLISRTVDGHGNVLTETDPNQNTTIYTYDAFDRMLTMSGPLGSGKTMTYDGNGNLTSEEVNNSTGNQITTNTYDKANRLKQVNLPEGGAMVYEYDGNGNISSETKPNGYFATYGYNDLNLPTLKTINQQTWRLSYDQVGNLKTETWPNGNIVTYVYDELNRELSQTDLIGLVKAQTYDADSNIKTMTDGNGELSTYNYNDLHQRVAEVLPLGRGHTYTYTVFGELLTDTGPNGTITHTVDTLGRRGSSSGPDGYDMTFGYDLNGNLTSQTDSRLITTTYLVNDLNQTYQQDTGAFTMTMSLDTLGNLLSQTDYRGITSEYTYDLENRQTSFTRAGLLQSETTYNNAGLVIAEKDARGKTTTHEYNTQYHKTRTNMPEGLVVTYTPDAFGDVLLQNNPGPNDTTRTYDLRRRLLTESNGAGETTRYEYDLNNNRTAVIKPGGQRWEYDFDAANRLTHVRNVPEVIETIYGYDTADNLETITDAKGRVTRFTYDNRNRKKTKTYPGNTDAVGYDYDLNGNLTGIQHPNGVDVTYSYDELNRQYNQEYSGTYGSASVTLTLDGNGNVENVSELVDGLSHGYSMTYDNLDRLTSKTDRYGNTFFYDYDANGNRTVFRDHDNQVTDYSYDDANRLKTLTQTGLGTFTWTYNTAGLPAQIAYPNGSEANYQYDNANRISLIDNKQSGVTVTSHEYDYDPNGNRTQLIESNIDASAITTYEYDNADRLDKVFYPNRVVTYTLDKVGNREQEVIDTAGAINTRTYVYNDRDQLTSITDTDGLTVSYDYDAFGNQTQKTENGTTSVFDYTPRQRVKSITVGTAQPHQYEYDYAGQRVKATSASGNEKRYLYDGLTLIAETNAIGNTLATYHYGARRQLAETRNGQRAYYLADALGTNVAITNQDGSIQNRMDYDVWGNLNQETSTSDSPFGFTGYLKDQDTDLYYANARYYDSFTGRFLREDPWQGDINTPPSLHRYNYAASNPNYYIDPTGLGNKIAHFDEKLLEAKIVGLNDNQAYLYALGAEYSDENTHFDAIENSSHLAIATMFLWPFESQLGPIREMVKRNNIGIHALTGESAEIMREVSYDFMTNSKKYGPGARDIVELSISNHTYVDSFYHITKGSLDSDDPQAFHWFLGHLFEWKTTDISYRNNDRKNIPAFENSAKALYEFAIKSGYSVNNVNFFESELDRAKIAMTQLNSKLNARSIRPCPAEQFDCPIVIDRKNIDESQALKAMFKVDFGVDIEMNADDHDPTSHGIDYISQLSEERLRGIAVEAKLLDSDAVKNVDKYQLAKMLDHMFRETQKKVRDIHYNRFNEAIQENRTQESAYKPGVSEVDQ